VIENRIKQLRERLGEIADLNSAVSILHWDQQTYMPPKGAEARGMQLATLSALSHRAFTSEEMGELLKELDQEKDRLDPDDSALVAEALYRYERATKLPEAFVHDLTQAESQAFEAWIGARKKSDFNSFAPHLDKLVVYQRRKADLLGYSGSPYNALLEDYERGMTEEQLREIFSELAGEQTELLNRILASPNRPNVGWLDREWDEKAQWDFGMKVLADLGYDLEAGRQDKSAHPFSTSFDIHDVRITTRLDPRDLFAALSSTLHEAGHALYEQGFRPEDRRTPLAEAPSMGMHESQSRTWENQIGKSLPFWKRYFPDLAKAFPGHLEGLGPEEVFRADNRVERSLIRVESDEVTYNLHIILRFEIETGLVKGSLKVAEVPEVWNAKMKEYLDLEVPDDAHGCLQDVHWSSASFGYFPTYALGNLYAAQMFEKAEADLPHLWSSVEQGDFSPLLNWLREKVHRHGRRKQAAELIEEITGAAPSGEAFLNYLNRKYGEIYGLNF
jgi:carboxypeptidase Taq